MRIGLAFIALALACTRSDAPAATRSLVLATTTSVQDTGLLDSLLPRFRAGTGIAVKVIAVGTGAALRMAGGGNADAVLVHAPEAEQEYIVSGDLVEGRLVMYNDFLFVGPPADPAGVRGRGDLRAVMRAIAGGGTFVSRGDASGTEQKERALWQAAGIAPDTLSRREATGQGMGATLGVADQHTAYTLTDRATWLALQPRLSLVPVYEGDKALLNLYHAYVVNPVKHRAAQAGAARRFVDFLVSPEVQRAIGAFGVTRFGRSLYVPAAGQDTAALRARDAA